MKNAFFFLVAILPLLPLSAQDNILNFDGNNDFVEVGDHALLDPGTGDFTVECRVKKLEGSFGWANTYALCKWNTASNPGNNEWNLGLTQDGNNEKPRFAIESGTTKHVADAGTPLTLNVWYHLAGVREGGEMRIYVNGVLENTSTTLGAADAVNNVGRNFRMAANIKSTPNCSEIELEEVRVWSVARTTAQIQANMESTVSPSTPGLVAYYQFDQGTACGNNTGITAVTDATGNGLDGNLTNLSMSGGCKSNLASESILPVELVGFSARLHGGKVALDWSTASEVNNQGFEVQRSTDFHDWTVLGFVPGHGTTDGLSDYFFDDHPLTTGTYYYRLRQMDTDGAFDYSPLRSVEWEGAGRAVSIFPNPANEHVTLSLPEMPDGSLSAKLFSSVGRQVGLFVLENDRSRIDLGQLSPGVYFLEIEGQPRLLKIVKQ